VNNGVIRNPPAFWAALVGVGVVWYLVPDIHPMLWLGVIIVAAGLVLRNWQAIQANTRQAFAAR